MNIIPSIKKFVSIVMLCFLTGLLPANGYAHAAGFEALSFNNIFLQNTSTRSYHRSGVFFFVSVNSELASEHDKRMKRCHAELVSASRR